MAHTGEPGCYYGTYNPSTHDTFEVCVCDQLRARRGGRAPSYGRGIANYKPAPYRETPMTQRNAQPFLKEGDLIELREGHKVYAELPEHFLYARKGVWTLARGQVNIAGDTSFLAGKYVVVKTATDGGGMNHDGPFPDGHHVWCESVDRKHKVDFYQSGCFTAMITDIKPIGRASLQWVVDGKPVAEKA